MDAYGFTYLKHIRAESLTAVMMVVRNNIFIGVECASAAFCAIDRRYLKLVTAKYNNKSVLEYQCETIC